METIGWEEIDGATQVNPGDWLVEVIEDFWKHNNSKHAARA